MRVERNSIEDLEVKVYQQTRGWFERMLRDGQGVATVSDGLFERNERLQRMADRVCLETEIPPEGGLQAYEFINRVDRVNFAMMTAAVDAVASQGGLKIERGVRMGLKVVGVKK